MPYAHDIFGRIHLIQDYATSAGIQNYDHPDRNGPGFDPLLPKPRKFEKIPAPRNLDDDFGLTNKLEQYKSNLNSTLSKKPTNWPNYANVPPSKSISPRPCASCGHRHLNSGTASHLAVKKATEDAYNSRKCC